MLVFLFYMIAVVFVTGFAAAYVVVGLLILDAMDFVGPVWLALPIVLGWPLIALFAAAYSPFRAVLFPNSN